MDESHTVGSRLNNIFISNWISEMPSFRAKDNNIAISNEISGMNDFFQTDQNYSIRENDPSFIPDNTDPPYFSDGIDFCSTLSSSCVKCISHKDCFYCSQHNRCMLRYQTIVKGSEKNTCYIMSIYTFSCNIPTYLLAIIITIFVTIFLLSIAAGAFIVILYKRRTLKEKSYIIIN
ncbi:hypothetical protein HZS_7345 [Henneguya salminicola]|nr:hypothetical protein HZS_7345 [Henneguya salminicola]